MADIELIKPRELPEQANVQPTDALMVDNGTIVGKATPEKIVNAGAPVASEAEALAGVNNTKRMTPLRVRQVLDNVNNPAVLRAQAWAESSTPPDPLLPDSKSAKTWASIAEQGTVMVQWSMIADDGQTVLGNDITTGEPIRAYGGVAQISVNGFGPITPEEYSVDSDGVVTLTAPLAEGDVVSGFTQPRLSNSEAQAVVQGVLQQTADDVRAAEAAAAAAAANAALVKPQFDSVAQLQADTAMTDATVPVGTVVWTPVSAFIRVSSGGDIENANGVKFNVKPDPDGYVSVLAYGDSVSDWQKAFNSSQAVRFPSGNTFLFPSSVGITKNTIIDATGAKLEGSGSNSGKDIFEFSSPTSFLSVIGGSYSKARWPFAIRSIDSATFYGCSFNDCAVPIGVNVIVNSPFSSTGKISISNCNFNDVECGAMIQSCTFLRVEFENNKCTNINSKSLTERPYPLDKKIASGLWCSSLGYSGKMSVYVSGNYVDGVAQITPESVEPETHGLAVHMDSDQPTDVIIIGNTVKNITGTSASEGVEGIMGRSNEVTISNNTLVDAGNLEGAIYAKGASFSKVTQNTIVVTSGYIHKDTSRGYIVDGDPNRNDVSGNKFYGLDRAIYTRSPLGKYTSNEFYDCRNCITLAMLSGVEHIETTVDGNYSNSGCLNFFTDVTSGSNAKGRFNIIGNNVTVRDYFLGGKGALDLIIKGNTVNRIANGTVRELILNSQNVTRMLLKSNTILSFQNSTGDGRVFSNNSGYVKSVYASENHIRSGDYGLWLTGQSYVDVVIRNNEFFECTPINVSSITVSGKNVVASNVGVDL